ncbi:hypothetical protein BC628DRAFT_1388918 [Trametes gibbosa]|nr:hypothetical protein BC628DRAFT_1388918 [Trametes gibbosa]
MCYLSVLKSNGDKPSKEDRFSSCRAGTSHSAWLSGSSQRPIVPVLMIPISGQRSRVRGEEKACQTFLAVEARPCDCSNRYRHTLSCQAQFTRQVQTLPAQCPTLSPPHETSPAALRPHPRFAKTSSSEMCASSRITSTLPSPHRVPPSRAPARAALRARVLGPWGPCSDPGT